MVLIVLKLLESLAAQNLFPDWIFHGLHLNCVTHSRTGQASVWFQSKRCHHEQSQDECSGSTLPTFPTAGLFSWLTWAQHALQVRIWHLNCWFSEEVHGWGQSFHTCNTIKQKALTQTYFEPKNIQRIRKAGCLETEESCGANTYSISRLQLELQETVNWPGIHCHHDQQEPLAMLLSRYGMIKTATRRSKRISSARVSVTLRPQQNKLSCCPKPSCSSFIQNFKEHRSGIRQTNNISLEYAFISHELY